MNVSFNRDHLTFKLSVNKETYEEDLLLGIRFERMLATEEWKLLAGEWFKADELYREAIMKVGMTDADSRITGKKAAAYNGFHEAVSFVKKFIDACNEYRKNELARMDEELKFAAGADITISNYD